MSLIDSIPLVAIVQLTGQHEARRVRDTLEDPDYTSRAERGPVWLCRGSVRKKQRNPSFSIHVRVLHDNE